MLDLFEVYCFDGLRVKVHMSKVTLPGGHNTSVYLLVPRKM